MGVSIIIICGTEYEWDYTDKQKGQQLVCDSLTLKRCVNLLQWDKKRSKFIVASACQQQRPPNGAFFQSKFFMLAN